MPNAAPTSAPSNARGMRISQNTSPNARSPAGRPKPLGPISSEAKKARAAITPTQATAQTEDISVLPGSQPNTVRVGKRFIPNVTGEWEVEVIASDEVGPPTEKLLAFEIEPDGPPCLAQWSPFASTDPGAYLPITEPTIFQVPVVDDDLDRYPGLANPKPTDYFGQATFEWSIKQPGSSSFQKIGTSTMQSRAIAGVAGGTYIFGLPGSPGACRDGWDEILKYQLDIRYRPCNFAELMPRLNEGKPPRSG